jgi:RNA polymerase sigma-70 factor (ECF subfamily)
MERAIGNRLLNPVDLSTPRILPHSSNGETLKREAVRELVRRAQGNDRDAFGDLYKLFHRSIYSLARFYLNSRADDAVSETFLRAWLALPRYRDTGRPFVAWLYGIARHVVAGELAVQKRVTPWADPPDQAIEPNHDDRLVLASAVGRLPKGQRRVIELKFLIGLSNEQTAKILGKSVGAVKAQQWRGLRALQHMLVER